MSNQMYNMAFYVTDQVTKQFLQNKQHFDWKNIKSIFWKHKHDSIEQTEVNNLIIIAAALHRFNVFKLQKQLRKNQPLGENFSTVIADSDLNELKKKKNRDRMFKQVDKNLMMFHYCRSSYDA